MSVFNYKYSPNDVEKMLPVASEEGVVCVDSIEDVNLGLVNCETIVSSPFPGPGVILRYPSC